MLAETRFINVNILTSHMQITTFIICLKFSYDFAFGFSILVFNGPLDRNYYENHIETSSSKASFSRSLRKVF